MASKALINTYGIIAIADAQMQVLLRELDEDSLSVVKPALEAAHAACAKAYKAWKGHIDERGMKRLKSILDRFHANVSQMDMETFTSTAIALLETLRAKITDRDRRGVLNELISAIYTVHEHFDPELDKIAAYKTASQLERIWNDILRTE